MHTLLTKQKIMYCLCLDVDVHVWGKGQYSWNHSLLVIN